MVPTAAMGRAVGPQADDQQIFDAIENAQELYERYLELSRIADIVPDDPPEPAPYEPPPIGIHLRPNPIISLI